MNNVGKEPSCSRPSHSAPAEVVKRRDFVGLITEQAASALGITLRTDNRRWAYARAWLCRRLSPAGDTL
jgi:hypothetical protein